MQLILRTGMYFAPLRVLLPLVAVLSAAFGASLAYDVVVLEDLTDKTVLLLLFATAGLRNHNGCVGAFEKAHSKL